MVGEALRKHAVKAEGTPVPIDVHLMVQPVDALAQAFCKAGADLVSFHPDAATHVDRTLQLIHGEGCQAGLVFNPATPLDVLEWVIDKVDLVLIMSVNPGFGGQSFIASALKKVEQARRPIEASGRDASLYERAWTRYQHHYDRINGEHAKVFDGVVRGLELLVQRGWRLACLTNKPTAFAIELLRRKHLASYFDVVFGGDAFERKKPDPLPLLKCCEALGTSPAQTLMIGDSSNDAAAARAAGCPVLLVTYGYNHGEPVRDIDADVFIDSLDELRLD